MTRRLSIWNCVHVFFAMCKIVVIYLQINITETYGYVYLHFNDQSIHKTKTTDFFLGCFCFTVNPIFESSLMIENQSSFSLAIGEFALTVHRKCFFRYF
jgi:hypothetical protein